MVVRADGDYYSLLGVDKGADKKTIKQAYRQKARKYHPVSLGWGTCGAAAWPGRGWRMCMKAETICFELLFETTKTTIPALMLRT